LNLTEVTYKIIRGKHKYYGTIIQKYRYRVSPNFGSKSIGDTTIDTTFENYRRYFDRYRKSIGDTADTDTLSPILTTLAAQLYWILYDIVQIIYVVVFLLFLSIFTVYRSFFLIADIKFDVIVKSSELLTSHIVV
jgi:hypothetical protein